MAQNLVFDVSDLVPYWKNDDELNISLLTFLNAYWQSNAKYPTFEQIKEQYPAASEEKLKELLDKSDGPLTNRGLPVYVMDRVDNDSIDAMFILACNSILD